MKAKLFVLSFFICVTFSVQANPTSFVDTSDLLSKCSASEKASTIEQFQEIHCIGYLSGILDGVQLIFSVRPASQFFCPPPQGISSDKLLSIIKKWVRNNPKSATGSARMTALIAYGKEYPCN